MGGDLRRETAVRKCAWSVCRRSEQQVYASKVESDIADSIPAANYALGDRRIAPAPLGLGARINEEFLEYYGHQDRRREPGFVFDRQADEVGGGMLTADGQSAYDHRRVIFLMMLTKPISPSIGVESMIGLTRKRQ